MRRFFRDSGFATLMAFVLVFAVAEGAVRTIHAGLPVDPGKWPRIEIAQKLDKLDRAIRSGRSFDVVLAGSSVMAGGIDPVVFTRHSDVSSYNAAWAGATGRTSAAWIADIIEPLAHPEIVVLGIQTGELNDNGPKNQITYKAFATSPGYEQTRSSLGGRVTSWFERLSYFFRFRRIFRTPTAVFGKDRAALERTKVRKEVGERGRRVEEPITYVFRDKFAKNFYEKNLVDLHLGGKEYRSLVRLARTLEDRGARLILLGTPVTEDFYSIHDDPAGAKMVFREMLKRFQRDTGATVIEAGDAFPTSAPFRDPVHLDIEGRVAFSKALAETWSKIASHEGGWFTVACRGSSAPVCRTRLERTFHEHDRLLDHRLADGKPVQVPR